jgi:hypothetical protein
MPVLRVGNALYAEVSAVPDVDDAQLERCTPTKALAGLRGASGLVVLDGFRTTASSTPTRRRPSRTFRRWWATPAWTACARALA